MEALCNANALLKQFITIQLVQLNITSNALNSNHSPSRLSRDIPRRATRHHPKCTTPNHLLNVQVASRDFPLSRERWIQVGFITRRLFISSLQEYSVYLLCFSITFSQLLFTVFQRVESVQLSCRQQHHLLVGENNEIGV